MFSDKLKSQKKRKLTLRDSESEDIETLKDAGNVSDRPSSGKRRRSKDTKMFFVDWFYCTVHGIEETKTYIHLSQRSHAKQSHT